MLHLLLRLTIGLSAYLFISAIIRFDKVISNTKVRGGVSVEASNQSFSGLPEIDDGEIESRLWNSYESAQ